MAEFPDLEVFLFIDLTCCHYNIIHSTVWLTRGAQGKALTDAP